MVNCEKKCGAGAVLEVGPGPFFQCGPGVCFGIPAQHIKKKIGRGGKETQEEEKKQEGFIFPVRTSSKTRKLSCSKKS